MSSMRSAVGKVISSQLRSGRIGQQRGLSTEAELKFVEDIIKTAEEKIPLVECSQYTMKHVDYRDTSHNQQVWPMIDCTHRDILSLKVHPAFLEQEHKIFAESPKLDSYWRRLHGPWDPQRTLEVLLSEHHGKEDTILYTASHEYILHLILSQMPKEDTCFINSRQEEMNQLQSNKKKYTFIHSNSNNPAAVTKHQVNNVHGIALQNGVIHLFQDTEELILTSYLLGKGNALTKVLSQPTIIQSSLNLINPGPEVRYISGPRELISWIRQLMERSHCVMNIPVHMSRLLLQILKNPSLAQEQMVKGLENASQLRKGLVELPCNITGDTFHTYLETESRKQQHAVDVWLRAKGIKTNRSAIDTYLKITSHSNHDRFDVERIVEEVSSAFVAHAQTQELM